MPGRQQALSRHCERVVARVGRAPASEVAALRLSPADREAIGAVVALIEAAAGDCLRDRRSLAAAMEERAFSERFRRDLTLEQAGQTGLIRRTAERIETKADAIATDQKAQRELADARLAALRLLLSDRTRADLCERLLGTIAASFEHDTPDAPPGRLAEYLEAQARTDRETRDRPDALGRAEGRIATLMGAATAALDTGDFEAADERLADAGAMQQAEHTLVQVRTPAALRVERGRAALLARAAAAYEAALEVFDPEHMPYDHGTARTLRDRLGLSGPTPEG